ncbi:aminotransferases class-ii pyridoxal-phosphate attachment site [Lucifera butyrica]|uniref:8-amino-7-ketopelargonate synthase n=1 Tax=Lucifera butyrica TaxID=1351585 RepID=A0A498RE31_9FIRM|nr:8-amino-7-oxononanoate synthase [Lucifera butyrica]VBB07448.1 aminotransferases class-ii pyridoxal-phosphate attachment site [Lucifera butyrica]
MKDWKEALAGLKQENLFRETCSYAPEDAVHVRLEGRSYLLLASNNYLGLTHSPAVKEAARAAIDRWGTGSGGARLTTGSHPLYAELETELARFKGTEAAVVFNTGYMANVGTISAVAGSGDVIFSDALNHASIIDGCRLSKARTVIFRHNDMPHLAACLAQVPCTGQRLIVVDGVFSMDGDMAPLKEITQLAERYSALVMVDEAHAAGVIGPAGAGAAAYWGVKDRISIHMGTLSKALASEGGYVAGSRELIAYLVNKARSFIFSTALSPASVAAALAALRELKKQPDLAERLLSNAQFVRRQLIDAGFAVSREPTPIIPVMVGSAAKAVQLSQALKEAGILISAIRPPTVPPDASRLRLTVSAAHEQTELAAAVQKIAKAAQDLGVLKGGSI